MYSQSGLVLTGSNNLATGDIYKSLKVNVDKDYSFGPRCSLCAQNPESGSAVLLWYSKLLFQHICIAI